MFSLDVSSAGRVPRSLEGTKTWSRPQGPVDIQAVISEVEKKNTFSPENTDLAVCFITRFSLIGDDPPRTHVSDEKAYLARRACLAES